MSGLSCDDNINLFQPTGFRVIIDRKHYGHLQYFTTRINHPGAQNTPDDTAWRGKVSVPMPGNTMTYGELTLDVLLDEDFESYMQTYNWMLRHINIEQIQEPFGKNSNKYNDEIPTYADIHVHALSSHNNPNITFKYYDCIPVSVGDIAFDAQNASVEPVTYPASFRFSYFEIESDQRRQPDDPGTAFPQNHGGAKVTHYNSGYGSEEVV